MESDAAAKLGEAVELTTVVSPHGQGKTLMTAGVIRQVAGVAGALAVTHRSAKERPDTPGGFKGGYMVLALGATKVGFFSMKRGLLKNTAGELIEELPREAITGFELGGGTLTSPLKVTLDDGTVWDLEVPRAQKGKTEKIAHALGF